MSFDDRLIIIRKRVRAYARFLGCTNVLLTPCSTRTGIVRVPHGNLQCLSYPRGPCGTLQGAVRQPYGHVRELTRPELAKLPHWRRIRPYGARTGSLRSPHGLFLGFLRTLNPYGARKLIMHALKLYRPRTGRQIRTARHGASAGPVTGRTIFVQNSPGTGREQPVRGPGVWCDWGMRH